MPCGPASPAFSWAPPPSAAFNCEIYFGAPTSSSHTAADIARTAPTVQCLPFSPAGVVYPAQHAWFILRQVSPHCPESQSHLRPSNGVARVR